jgi:hypothetical protein
LPDQETLINEALETAKLIASKSPVAVQGSKVNLIYSRDHSVEEGLKFMVIFVILIYLKICIDLIKFNKKKDCMECFNASIRRHNESSNGFIE